MTTILNPRLWLVLALIALLAYIVAIVPGLADLPKLPQTDHAQSGHEGQAWDAAAIVTAMSGGNCGPVDIYQCDDDTFVYTCQDPLNAARLLGLRVGATSHKIITGHTARTSYWQNQTASCTYLGPGGFAQ